jgi:hypothetical protein
MTKNYFKLKKSGTVLLLLTIMSFTACTKVDKGDDFPKGDPPPVAGGFTYSSEIAKTNLVGYWAFNGSLIDSVTGVSATNAGTTFDAGKKGQGYKGSATAYATFNPSTTLQTLKSYTIAFWINSPVNTGAIGIFTIARTDDFWGSLDIYQDNGGTADKAVFKVHMFNSAVPWGGQFTDAKVNFGTWVHLTATYDATTSVFNIYQNGSAIGVNTAGNPGNTISPVLHGDDPAILPPKLYGNLNFVNATKMAFGAFQFQTTPSLTAGASSQSWATNFAGNLDEFRIYNRALTGQEVSALYQLEKQGR